MLLGEGGGRQYTKYIDRVPTANWRAITQANVLETRCY